MTSILFGLATAAIFAASGLMYSRAVKVIGPWSAVAWSMVVGITIVIPLVAWAGIPDGLGTHAPGLLAAGAGNVAGLALAGFAFRVGKVGIVAPIIATEGAISAVLAALTGQSIAPVIAFWLLLIVVGVMISAVAPDPEPLRHERPVLAVVLSLLSAVAFGIGLFSAGSVSDEVPIAWLLLSARAIGILVIVLPLVVTRNLRITRGTVPLVVGMGICEVAGTATFAIGAQYDIAVTSVLASQFAPIAAVMAYLLFRERLGRLQVTGVAVLVIAVTALSIAS